MIRNFFLITEAAGRHTLGHVTCTACMKEKDMLISIGGQEMVKLFEMDKVTINDQYDAAITKVITALSEMKAVRKDGSGDGLVSTNMISLECDLCEYNTKF